MFYKYDRQESYPLPLFDKCRLEVLHKGVNITNACPDIPAFVSRIQCCSLQCPFDVLQQTLRQDLQALLHECLHLMASLDSKWHSECLTCLSVEYVRKI